MPEKCSARKGRSALLGESTSEEKVMKDNRAYWKKKANLAG